MKLLELPGQLKGPWHHALMMTYGLDVPFFENAVWSQFAASCRHKIILADGHQFLEACSNYARSGLIRYLNQRYVAGGIYTQHAAHAKLILLTNPEQGRLLVGSGNLNLQGYASGGELFTQYEYRQDSPQSLGAFLTIREFLEGLMETKLLTPVLERHVKQMLEQAPWLYQAPVNTWRPVRHNLSVGFLDQLAQAVGGETVEELWILVPFYDEGAIALQRTIDIFAPRTTKILVQPGHTSVDPKTLSRIQIPAGAALNIHAVDSLNGAYLHAKLYVLKLANKAICLQGSANMSQVAMLRTVLGQRTGNAELGNLLEGPRDAFDHLFETLAIHPKTDDLMSLELSIDPRDEDRPTDFASAPCRLTGGEWYEQRLTLYYNGELPGTSMNVLRLNIDGHEVSLEIESCQSGCLHIAVSPEIGRLLQRPVPVSLTWQAGAVSQATNPIFVCNRATLEAEVTTGGGDVVLEAVGELDIDSDLEQLVAELDNSLIIDRGSAWKLIGRSYDGVLDGGDNEQAAPLSYAQIDYEMLRRHPKMQQYLTRGTGGTRNQSTRLHIILNAIIHHFSGLQDLGPFGELTSNILRNDEDEIAETAEEREAEAAERQRRQLSHEQRIRRIFKSFIKRYLSGIRSPDFRAFAGFEVMVNNYVIFSHLLWQLSLKEWFEPELAFLFESQLTMWRFFWGEVGQEGYLADLSDEDRTLALEWMREQAADARVLAALYRAAQETQEPKWSRSRIALRDFWRHFLTSTAVAVTPELIEDLWLLCAEINLRNPVPPHHIVKSLEQLARYDTESQFLDTLAKKYGLPRGGLSFDRAHVMRTINSIRTESSVRCLVVRTDHRDVQAESAIAMLRDWMQFEDLDYFRISFSRPDEPIQMLFYEPTEALGAYWDERSGEEQVITSLDRLTSPWEPSLNTMKSLAETLETSLSLPVARPLHSSRTST